MELPINRQELWFKALAGLAGGAIGWIPVEIASSGHNLTEAMSSGAVFASYFSIALFSALVGGAVLASAWQRLELTPQVVNSFIRGFIVCFVLALPANYYSNVVFSGILNAGGWGLGQQGSMPFLVLGRIVSWTMMGAMLGAGVGIASFTLGNIAKGAIGGLVGGFLGGLAFDVTNAATGGGLLSRLIGLSMIGLAIGLLIGLVHELTKTAWVTVEAGRLKGRQYRLEGSVISIGRAEENPVGLFGDPAVQARHAVIEHRGNDYILRGVAVSEGTFVNGERVESTTLREGDRIGIGSYELAFHVRQDKGILRTAGVYRDAGQPPRPIPPRGSSGPALIDPGGQRLPILAGQTTHIGRALDNQIVISHSSVSRHHAEIVASDGTFVMRDLGSQNGTFVGGQRITETALKDGDAVRLGDAGFTFRA